MIGCSERSIETNLPRRQGACVKIVMKFVPAYTMYGAAYISPLDCYFLRALHIFTTVLLHITLSIYSPALSPVLFMSRWHESFHPVFGHHLPGTVVPALGYPCRKRPPAVYAHVISVPTHLNVKLPAIGGHLPNADADSHLLVVRTCY